MSEDLAIRARPRPVKRFSKKALLIGAGGLALTLSAALAFALQPVSYDDGPRTELYNVTHKPMAEGLEQLPATYDEVKPAVPVLGPPLPGDLGRAYMAGGSQSEELSKDNPFRYERGQSAPRTVISRSRSVRPAPQPVQTIPDIDPQHVTRSSSLFFEVGNNQAKPTTPSAQPAFGGGLIQDPLLAGLDPSLLRQAGLGTQPVSAGAPPTPNTPSEIQELSSPYTVMAGTLIPATLVTGINSDLPGQVIGQVTENVHDTVSGRYLLIPQGSKLIGTYDARQSYGDKRAFVTWSRLIFPNGSSVNLANMASVDAGGYAGLRDDVDNHTGSIVKAGILSSVLGVGTELATDDDDRIVRALQNSGQSTVNIAGQRIVDRSLNVEPTITIRPGWRFSVMVSEDLILKPYANSSK